jgi:prophage antirepressor-like protein
MDRTQNMHYEGHVIRTYHDGRHLWFAASDLARALGFRDGYAIARSVADGDKAYPELETEGGRQRSAIISDIGLIVFASRSLKPSGRRLLLWVLDELTS